MTQDVIKEIQTVLNRIEKLYPSLHKLEGTLQCLGIDLGEALPLENGHPKSPADYGHAIKGLAKFLMAIGECLTQMAGEDDERTIEDNTEH